MKLNFWQWLGVVMLLLATPLWIYNKMTERKQRQMGTPTLTTPYPEEEDPTTQPATAPAAAATAPGA